MQVTINDTKEATCKFFAVKDRKFRNAVNASLYTEAEKAQAFGMKFALELVYWCKDIHVNYNKKSITVKVDKGGVKDAQALATLERDWAQRGVAKKLTAQGVTYVVA